MQLHPAFTLDGPALGSTYLTLAACALLRCSPLTLRPAPLQLHRVSSSAAAAGRPHTHWAALAADLEARLAQGQRLTTPQIMVLLDAHKHAQPAEAAADGSGLLSTANSSALFDGLTDSCQLAASPTGLQDACIAS